MNSTEPASEASLLSEEYLKPYLTAYVCIHFVQAIYNRSIHTVYVRIDHAIQWVFFDRVNFYQPRCKCREFMLETDFGFYYPAEKWLCSTLCVVIRRHFRMEAFV